MQEKSYVLTVNKFKLFVTTVMNHNCIHE